MKLELILPKQKNVKRARIAYVPLLSLGIVAALTPKDVDVSITDERIAYIDLQQ